MDKSFTRVLAAAALLVATLGLVPAAGAQTAAGEAATAGPVASPTPEADATNVAGATTVAQAFPDGLPVGAVQIDATTVSFDGGAEILSLEGIGFSDCVSGDLCFWGGKDFSGQSLVTTDCCTWMNLSDWGFNNMMSSWRNHRPYDSEWAYGQLGGGTVRCMPATSNMSYVGDTDNDKATSVRLKSVSGTC